MERVVLVLHAFPRLCRGTDNPRVNDISFREFSQPLAFAQPWCLSCKFLEELGLRTAWRLHVRFHLVKLCRVLVQFPVSLGFFGLLCTPCGQFLPVFTYVKTLCFHLVKIILCHGFLPFCCCIFEKCHNRKTFKILLILFFSDSTIRLPSKGNLLY